MGKMKELYTDHEEALYDDYLESQRNELRQEGQREACLMIKYDLEQKYERLIVWAKPSEQGPTALREAIEIVEKYL